MPPIILRLLLAFGGTLCGAILGAVLGIAIAAGAGFAAQLTHPNDPSAGSVAIIVIGTAPAGFLIGAAIGFALTWTRTAKRFEQ